MIAPSIARSGICVLAMWAATNAPALAQPTLTNIGTLPGGTTSSAAGVSGDGSAVVGTSEELHPEGWYQTLGFRWTAAQGMMSIGILQDAGGHPTEGYAANQDGSIIVGRASEEHGFARAVRWTPAQGTQNLGVLGHRYGSSWAYDVSDNGMVIVGKHYDPFNPALNCAIRFGPHLGMQPMGTLPGTTQSAAHGVSGNGSVIVGVSGPLTAGLAFRWTVESGMQSMGVPTGWSASSASAISRDGSVIVGSVHGGALPGGGAFRWDEQALYEILPVLPTANGAKANAVNRDGTVIVGQAFLPARPTAVMWTDALGVVDLNTHLHALGVDLAGWTLTSATGISDDGSVLVGTGLFEGQQRAWMVSNVPAPGAAVLPGMAALFAMSRRRRTV